MSRLLPSLLLLATAALGWARPPVDAPPLPLSELRAGMTGEVWTVFQGFEPEPFTVEVVGVIQNALGPGKSMILCRLTDPRVQKMGAVAGMSGSPLYIEGRLAGALSYQVQRFETERFAGFTPVEDLHEVKAIALAAGPRNGHTLPARDRSPLPPLADDGGLTPLSPVFTFGGLSPQVAQRFAAPFAALGLQTSTLGGSAPGTKTGRPAGIQSHRLLPGEAVAAALAVGDITLAGTGTVSAVDGDRVLAFGHPMLGLGEVEVPMATAEIVAILPSSLSSMKIANTGAVIGTVRQDRLSAIYGELGPGPELVPMTVHTPQRTLRFATVRHPRLTPVIAAAGLTQAVLGSNDAGLSEGFRVATQVRFPNGETLRSNDLFAGPTAFNQGLESFTQRLSLYLLNPVEETFPAEVSFTVEPLPANPTASLDGITVSHREIRPGETLEIDVTLRDFQSQPVRARVQVDVPVAWAGRNLDVLVLPGPALDQLELGQNNFPVSQIRDFSAFLDLLARQRRSDGLYVAVVERATAFVDQTTATLELPGSLARVAQTSDGARYRSRPVRTPLWETHLLPDRIVNALERRALSVVP
jgi:hypothetical protein